MLRPLVFAAFAVLAGLAAPALAQESSPPEPLAQQARYWENKGRYDLARESWLKLFRTSPDNTDALAGIALAEARSGRPAASQVYLDKLREANPRDPRISVIEDAIRSGTFDASRLEEPRKLGREGRYDEALAAYREVFGNEIPSGRYGLEYWQTMAGAKDGWEPARAGIAELVEAYPDEPIYRLALAQHLTYHEETRRVGIESLQKLAGNAAVAVQTRQAWRQALLWLGTRPADEPYYRTYIAKFGNDAQVSAKLGEVRENRSAQTAAPAAPRAPTPEQIRGREVEQAYARLDENDLQGASFAFEGLIERYPQQADILGGLGIIRLRQERYAEARSLLEQASSRAPASAARWREALVTARFWEKARAAEDARKSGNLGEAETLLRAAIAADPAIARNEPSVKSALADVLAENGKAVEAEKLYQEILAGDPNQVNATRGMIGILSRSGRMQQALTMAERLPPAQQAELGSLGSLRGSYLRDEAGKALKAKDDAQAERLLRQALLEDPESPWTRLELARIYQRQHRIREANTLVDGLIGGGKPIPDALYVKAMLLAEQQNWYQGLEVLEQVSPASRTQPMADLQRRLWVRYQAQRAGVYARYGRQPEATAMLQQLEAYADTPELLGAMAGGWADAGEDGRALAYIRQALTRQASPDVGLRLQYAALLFKLRQDAEFEVVAEELVRYPDFTDQQALDLANLRIAYRLRQADLVREEGNLARAYDYLAPLLRVNPNDPRLMMALARLYNDAKDYQPAYDIYQRVLKLDPSNLDAYKGGIGAALALKRNEDAQAMLDEAMRLEPNNPRLYALAGRAARERGDDGRALELFKQALQLDQQRGGASEFGDGRYTPELYLIDPASSPVNAPYYGSLQLPASSPGPPARASKASWPARTSSQVVASTYPVQAKAVYSGRADRAITPMPRWWKQGRLIKVASRPEPVMRYSVAQAQDPVSAYPPPSAPPAAPVPTPYPQTYPPPTVPAGSQGGYRTWDPAFPAPPAPAVAPRAGGSWVQSTPDRFSYSTELRQAPVTAVSPLPLAPARLPAAPVTVQALSLPAASVSAPAAPVPSAPKSLPRFVPSAPADPGLRSELLRDMGELTSVPATSPPPQAAYPAAGYSSGPALQLRADPVLATPAFARPRQNVQAAQPNEVLREIADINAQRAPYFGFGVAARNREGVKGLDKLSDLEAPIEGSVAAIGAGRFKLRVVPVYLEAGTVEGSRLPLFGTMALVNRPSLRFDQNFTGVAVAGVYENRSFRADFGSSPLGADVENLVGGINWRPQFDRTSLKIDLSRRSVTDSFLSYVGTIDPGTARAWGGVTKTGGRLDIAFDGGPYGVYGDGSYHVLQGKNVADNNVLELGGGVYARGYESRYSQLTYGLNLTTFFYDKNLRRFTLGQGGYFSPQSYFSISVPVEWATRRGRSSFRLHGALGVQSFHEDSSALYPNDSDLQAAAEAVIAENEDADFEAFYPSQTSTGLGFNFGGEMEYLLSPNLVIGGAVGIDNARDYNETSLQGYVRYLFAPRSSLDAGPSVLSPYYNFGDPTQ